MCLTAELVVPPGSQVTVEPPTATVAPTATTEVIEEVAEVSGEEEERARVNVPNRGYNSYGDAGCSDHDVRFFGLFVTALRDLAPRDGCPDA